MTDKANGPLLDRAQIQELLNELGRRCASHGISADLLIVGGGAIAPAYSNDRATRDIDAIFEPKMLVYQEAERMVNELGIPRDWLNDAVKGLMPDLPDDGRQAAHCLRCPCNVARRCWFAICVISSTSPKGPLARPERWPNIWDASFVPLPLAKRGRRGSAL